MQESVKQGRRPAWKGADTKLRLEGPGRGKRLEGEQEGAKMLQVGTMLEGEREVTNGNHKEQRETQEQRERKGETDTQTDKRRELSQAVGG